MEENLLKFREKNINSKNAVLAGIARMLETASDQKAIEIYNTWKILIDTYC